LRQVHSKSPSSQAKEERIEKVARGASSVTIAVFISRILGLVREQVLAYFFGAGKSMDTFVVAYRIPNLLRDLFAEGASQAAFVKVFSSTLEHEGKERALTVAKTLLANFILVSGSVVLLMLLFAPSLVELLAPAFKETPSKFSLAVNLTYITIPFLFFISLASLFAGLLNSLGYFFLPALSSGLFNLSSILIGVFGYFLLVSLGIEPIYAMAVGVTLGGCLQALMQVPLLLKEGFSLGLKPDFTHSAFKEVLRLIGPTIFGLSIMQINIFVNTYFATSCGEGAVSWYSYAFRVMYVPLGLFGVGITQALLPELTRILSQKERQAELPQARDLFTRSLALSLSLSLPSSAGLYLLAQEIISVLFERGKFTSFDTEMTGALLAILSLALPFYSASKTIIPLFYSLGKTYIPALASGVALLVNLAVILLSIKKLGIKAVALGTTASLISQCLFLSLVSVLYLRGLSFRVLFRAFGTILFGTAMMSLLVYGLKFYFFEQAKLPKVWLILLAVPAGAGVYYAIVKLFGPREAYLMLDRLFGIFFKPLTRVTLFKRHRG
jgi:putative peptidoglycan lipid II flippase